MWENSNKSSWYLLQLSANEGWKIKDILEHTAFEFIIFYGRGRVAFRAW